MFFLCSVLVDLAPPNTQTLPPWVNIRATPYSMVCIGVTSNQEFLFLLETVLYQFLKFGEEDLAFAQS